MSVRRTFSRRIEALNEIFAFTAEAGGPGLIANGVLPTVDLVLEELFTNIVKYGRGTSPLSIAIEPILGGLEVTLDDPDAEHFDVTRAPDADTTLPIELRQPGGLGLHLIKRMVDCIDYQYIAADRHSRVRFRKTQMAPSNRDGAVSTGERDAQD